MEAAGTILDSPSIAAPPIAAPPIGSPSIGRTIITPEPSTLERAFGVVADTAETPEPAADRSTGNRVLRTRLFVIDLIGAVFCWAWLGYVLTDAKTVPGRVLPGIVGAVATLIAMRATGLYRSRLCVRRADELWRIFAANLWGAVAFVIVEWQLAMPGTEFLACGAACIALVGAGRWQYGRWLRGPAGPGSVPPATSSSSAPTTTRPSCGRCCGRSRSSATRWPWSSATTTTPRRGATSRTARR